MSHPWNTSLRRFDTICLAACIVVGLMFYRNAHADRQLPTSVYVDGYANQLSVAPGEEIAFHLSTNANSVSLAIERPSRSMTSPGTGAMAVELQCRPACTM